MKDFHTSPLLGRELRTIRRQLVQINRRLALTIVPGKVKPGSQDFDKRTVRLVLGKDSDGKEILSPPVRWQQPGAGSFQMHAPPADNEQMDLVSPSGTIGEGSKAVWGTYDDDHQPPSKSDKSAVLQFGKTKVELSDDGFVAEHNGNRLVIADGEVVTYGKTRLNDGNKPIHRVGDADSDGDTAVGGADGVYA